MKWKAGQKVVCDRLGQQATNCYVRKVDLYESVIIYCPSTNTVVCGQRQNLERLGWRTEP
ncbi:hypothetical protein [Stenomitos frigidus]|uniref:hypothetical protein n=1 Tax=Stenomitos frigidus TaxID=1886765 RepID=UPI0011B263E7|nr:hypothetical protein [Stenomitos frigidus]